MVARRSRLSLANAFAGAAGRYWLGVLPQVGRELHHWEECADRIPDPLLRRHALGTQRSERGNLEGAAAFAILAPRAERARVVRAAVAFQATYDYIDTLAEQPSSDPIANGRQLHLALLTALEPDSEHPNYYAHHRGEEDNGYIRHLIDTCRRALDALPSYRSVTDGVVSAARRMVSYQSFNHAAPGEAPGELARWASTLTPEGAGLQWWETAAGSASSLGVLALIAAAGRPLLSPGEALATEHAYFPWIGALHVLLDSLIDRRADAASGHHSLVEHYASFEEAATRLSAITTRAVRATEMIPESLQHELMLAAMTSFYLSAPSASTPGTCIVTRGVLDAVGVMAGPAMAVQRARRIAGEARGGSPVRVLDR